MTAPYAGPDRRTILAADAAGAHSQRKAAEERAALAEQKLAKVTAELDELLALRARAKLLPLESAPQDRDQYIRVYSFEVFRWLPYKPNSNEFKRGQKGRWQKHTGYGFDNAELEGLGYQLLGDDGNPIAAGSAS